ncbi:MAG: polysaccharide biosynthesis/export family protein [Desulfobacteraceae bacterium]|jgi:polysaccharide export outer membrane protein
MESQKEKKYNRKPVSFLWALILILFLLPACYSSTAVRGTPVKDLALAEDQRVLARMPSLEDKDLLREMSRVKENKVFAETAGIPEYRIGPLDVLEINSHIGDKVRTTTVTVNSRGRISYSFIDDLETAGLTPSELDRLLTRKLSSYIRNPRIDILVKEFKSKKATVIGEFASLRTQQATQAASGEMYLKGRTTLLDLIGQAGGYTVDADIKSTRLIRGGRAYVINLFDIIEKGDLSQNVIIDDGDTVDIPELPEFGERVYVMGEVVKQGIYPLKDAQDLLAALSLAGSITRLAKEENTLIVRGYELGKEPLVMMSDVKALLRKADLGQNIRLQDGDLVYIPRMLIGDINDWIENTKPLLELILYPGRFDAYYTAEGRGVFVR